MICLLSHRLAAQEADTDARKSTTTTEPTAAQTKAAEEDAGKKKLPELPDTPPDAATIQAELQGLSGEERANRIKEYREKYGKAGQTTAPSPENVSEEQWNALTPDQKKRYLQTWQATKKNHLLSAEQQQDRLKLAKESLDLQVRELKSKQLLGATTPLENDQLKLMEKRLDQMRRMTVKGPVTIKK